MKKDVIYVDIEDDITAIIEKVKDAGAQIVALVPPKRIGVLQSIVNLKLLVRAADHAKKRIVLITNDHALTALAAGLSIPIAKNLQSKPEIAPIAVLDGDDDDVIHGEEVIPPASDIAMPASPAASTKKKSSVAAPAVGVAALAADKAPKKATIGTKIPNFETFRKKLFIIVPLAILLIGALVWALFFAGHATVAITAKTNVVNISKTLQLTNGGSLDAAQGVVPAIMKQTKKTATVDFTPTGKKDVGDKASGSVKLSQQSLSSTTVAAGTVLTTAGGLTFTTNTAATVPASTVGPGCFPTACAGSTTVGVTATAPGSKYNTATGSLTGAGSGTSASFIAPTSGGTDKTATVVSADDIAKAREQLKSQDVNAVKDELKKQFGADDIVIDSSFTTEPGEPTSTPGVDQEATTAKLTAETTHTLVGIKRSNLKAVYDTFLKTQIKNSTTQKVYESGDTSTQFISFEKNTNGYSMKVAAVAQVGPNIDTAKLAEDIKGLRTGEVQQLVGSIQGVENVDVTYSPFWVNKVPDDVKRIKITFTLNSNG